MNILIKSGLFCCLIFAAPLAARAQSGTICGNPANKKCVGQYDGFEPQDLIFNTGRARLGTGTRHESNEFYAIVLEGVKAEKPDGADCNFISETKRLAAQKLFPQNKVFTSRENCSGTIVIYLNTNEKYNFMAVYAGATETEAEKILTKAKKNYASANIRKLKVVLDFSDQ